MLLLRKLRTEKNNNLRRLSKVEKYYMLNMRKFNINYFMIIVSDVTMPTTFLQEKFVEQSRNLTSNIATMIKCHNVKSKT